jgi:hypothetical protein
MALDRIKEKFGDNSIYRASGTLSSYKGIL